MLYLAPEPTEITLSWKCWDAVHIQDFPCLAVLLENKL